MSKELEAFQRLLNTPDYECEPLEEGMNKDDVEIVKKALTPPTADEVCKQLSDELGCGVYFLNNNFYGENTFGAFKDFLIVKYFDFDLDFCFELKVKTALLVCRFYEGLEK